MRVPKQKINTKKICDFLPRRKAEYAVFDLITSSWRIGNRSIRLSQRIYMLCLWMDGKTSDKILIQRFKKTFGIVLSEKDFVELVHRLKKVGIVRVNRSYLKSKVSLDFLKKGLEFLNKKRIREFMFGDISYKSNPFELKKDIRKCFNSVNNCKVRSICKKIVQLKGIIVPHSNIELSGPCAAWAYKALSFFPPPDTIIIFGTNHLDKPVRPFCVVPMNFRTPFGIVKVDRDIIRMLEKKCDFDIYGEDHAHLGEHSIEIQLPFLQYCYFDKLEKLKIVPILCSKNPSQLHLQQSFSEQQNQFIQIVHNILNKSSKHIVCIGSGDLVHQKGSTLKLGFHQKNREIIRLLEKADIATLKHIGHRYKSCGVSVFIPFLMSLASTQGKVLDYSWSLKPKCLLKETKSNIHQYENPFNIGYVSMVFF